MRLILSILRNCRSSWSCCGADDVNDGLDAIKKGLRHGSWMFLVEYAVVAYTGHQVVAQVMIASTNLVCDAVMTGEISPADGFTANPPPFVANYKRFISCSTRCILSTYKAVATNQYAMLSTPRPRKNRERLDSSINEA